MGPRVAHTKAEGLRPLFTTPYCRAIPCKSTQSSRPLNSKHVRVCARAVVKRSVRKDAHTRELLGAPEGRKKTEQTAYIKHEPWRNPGSNTRPLPDVT